MRMAESFYTTAVVFANCVVETAGKACTTRRWRQPRKRNRRRTLPRQSLTKWRAKTTARKLAEKTEIEEGKEVKKTYTELVCVADKDRRSSQKSAFTKGKADVNKYLTEELASLTKI